MVQIQPRKHARAAAAAAATWCRGSHSTRDGFRPTTTWARPGTHTYERNLNLPRRDVGHEAMIGDSPDFDYQGVRGDFWLGWVSRT